MAQKIKVNCWADSRVAVGPEFRVVGVCPKAGAVESPDMVQDIIDRAVQLDFDQLPPLDSPRFFRLFLDQLRMELDDRMSADVWNLEDLFEDAVIVNGDELFRRNVNIERLSGDKGRRIEVYDHDNGRLLMMITGPWEEPDEEVTVEPHETGGAKSHENLVNPSSLNLNGLDLGNLSPVHVEEPAPEKPAKGSDAAVPAPKKRSKVWSWVERVFFILCICFLIAALVGVNDDKDGLQNQIRVTESVLSDTKSELRESNVLIDRIGEKMPIMVESLNVGVVDNYNNVLVSHGSTIYSSATQYLSPQITGEALVTGTVELEIRFFNNWVLDSKSSGRNKTVYTRSITLTKGDTGSYILGGWGSTTAGWLSSGNYRFEVWYKDMCLAAKDFRVN